MAVLAATPARPADLLPGAVRGLRDPHRPDWNVKASGAGHVTCFQVRTSFLKRYPVHQVGGQTILEYWIPAEDLPVLNDAIVGRIELVADYRA